MTHSPPSWPTSPPARIDWRPSRLLRAALCLLGACALAALWWSALPAPACLGATATLPLLVAWQVRRERDHGARELVWAAGSAAATLVGDHGAEPVEVRGVDFRGALVALRFVDASGRARRLVWWPDTLSSADRRALRIAAATRPEGMPILPLVSS